MHECTTYHAGRSEPLRLLKSNLDEDRVVEASHLEVRRVFGRSLPAIKIYSADSEMGLSHGSEVAEGNGCPKSKLQSNVVIQLYSERVQLQMYSAFRNRISSQNCI